jgi:hypothetical protein
VGSIERFCDDDAGYLRWLATNRSGYVINIQRGLNPSDARLHRAHCHWISGQKGPPTTGGYIKLCSVDLLHLDAWATTQLGATISRCATCKPPSSAPTTQRMITPMPSE